MSEKCIEAANHVPLYYYPNPVLHSFTFCLYLKAGSMYEEPEENGITHFLEHIVFRNANRLMDGNLYKELDRLGFNFNGVTYREFVQFSISGASCHFEEGIRLLLLLLEPLTLSTKEINIERKRIKAEIRETSEKGSLDYFTNQLIWSGTSLTQMIPGGPAVLDKIGKRALLKAQKELIAADNCFFYLTGAFTKQQAEQTAQAIGQYPLLKAPCIRKNEAPIPEVFFHRVGKIELKNSDYTYVRISFDVKTSSYTDAELTLLSDILFDGDYCQIFQELSEKTGYIYSFNSCFEKYNNIGNLYFAYEVSLANLEISLKSSLEIFQKIKQGIGEGLDYVLTPYTDNCVLLLDDPEDLNWTMAYEGHVLEQKYKNLEERKQAFLAVTPGRLSKLAREIFIPSNLSITIKGDKNKLTPVVLEQLEQLVKKSLTEEES